MYSALIHVSNSLILMLFWTLDTLPPSDPAGPSLPLKPWPAYSFPSGYSLQPDRPLIIAHKQHRHRNGPSGNSTEKKETCTWNSASVSWAGFNALCSSCLLSERSLLLMTFLRAFVPGPADAWRARRHTHTHSDTLGGTRLLIDASFSPLALHVCVCLLCAVLSPFLSHTSFPKHVKETLIDTSSGLNNVFYSS